MEEKRKPKELKNYATSAENLAKYLRNRGEKHRRYKSYTSIERALAVILSGNVYFSDGSNWNDLIDGKHMAANRKAYGKCFSWTTAENIAMWMLYDSEGHGKKGAMLDFPQKIIKEMINTPKVALGNFQCGEFVTQEELEVGKDCDIWVTDIIYSDPCKDGSKIKLSLGDEHATVNSNLLDPKCIYEKNIGWAYERECRMIIELRDESKKPDCTHARITLSKASARELQNNLYRSPVFKGSHDYGMPSKLQGVSWEI